MHIDVETKLNIGDKVFLVVYPTELDDKFDTDTSKLVVFETSPVLIRVYDDHSVQYFFDGLVSYEGENWFDEYQSDYYIPYMWFFKKEDAQEFCDLSNSDDIDNTQAKVVELLKRQNDMLTTII